MAYEIKNRWEPQTQAQSRQDRKGGFYHAYVPDPIVDWDPVLPSDIAADIADAEAAIRDLNLSGSRHTSLEGLARLLLRAESVGSSRIEGLQVGAARIATAELVSTEGGEFEDRAAAEILANVNAMESAIENASGVDKFGLPKLLQVHSELMRWSPQPQIGGVIRQEQNWIGGSSYSPLKAVFVPPPHEEVPRLMEDLLSYVNGDAHSPLAQAAIAHAQFETIHPFVDGNGRTGRALIHVVLKRRGVAPNFVPPISLILATWSADYVESLQSFRHLAQADSAERSESIHELLRLFASATIRACGDAQIFATDVDNLTKAWQERVGKVRSDSATAELIRLIPGSPVLTVNTAARLIGKSIAATNNAVNALTKAGVLSQRNVHNLRYRIFESREAIDLFTGLERKLASPIGDTAVEQPSRPTPARPNSPSQL